MEKGNIDFQQQNNYYRQQFINSFRCKDRDEDTMTFIVKEDTDLLVFAEAAKAVWESLGDYPSSFTGLVKMESGNAFATFRYKGALEQHPAA